MSAREEFAVSAGDPLLDGVPEIIMFGNARHRIAEQRLAPHFNAGIEICLCRSGIYRWDVEGESVEIRPGEISVTRPWQLHSGENNILGPGHLTWLIVPADGTPASLDAPHLRPLLGADADDVLAAFVRTPDAYVGEVAGTEDALDRVHDELRVVRPGRGAALRGSVALLLVLVARALAALDTTAPGRSRPRVPDGVLTVLREVEADPAAEWTAAGMASRAGLGLTAFTEWCKRVTGRSPRWHVLERRLVLARTLLLESDVPVTEIAYRAGFSSSQHFASAFRKLYGESPSVARKQVMQSRQEPRG